MGGITPVGSYQERLYDFEDLPGYPRNKFIEPRMSKLGGSARFTLVEMEVLGLRANLYFLSSLYWAATSNSWSSILDKDANFKELGISRSAYSQIETGERKVCAEELFKLSEIFKVDINSMLDLKKGVEVILEEKKESKEKTVETPVMRISVPQKNFEKFKEVLLYILNKVSSKANVGETVIYKFLYFIDFDYYEKYEEQLIGASYIKNKYGPTPVEFAKLVDKMIKEGEIEKVDSDYYSYSQTKYLPLRKPDLKKTKRSRNWSYRRSS